MLRLGQGLTFARHVLRLRLEGRRYVRAAQGQPRLRVERPQPVDDVNGFSLAGQDVSIHFWRRAGATKIREISAKVLGRAA